VEADPGAVLVERDVVDLCWVDDEEEGFAVGLDLDGGGLVVLECGEQQLGEVGEVGLFGRRR
jgi:hypothetical protein